MVQNLSQPVRVQFSNQAWCLSFSSLDIVVVEENGVMLGHPLLTVLCDIHSSVVLGYYLDLGKPNLHMTVAALKHAILRKNYPLEDGLLGDWAVYGVPEILVVDASTIWTLSNFMPLRHLLEKLDVTLVQRTAPSEGTNTERFVESFSSIVKSPPLISTGHSATVEGYPRLTLVQLNRLLVQYIVNAYNQSLHPRACNQTRLERWQSGLTSNPQVLSEQNFKV